MKIIQMIGHKKARHFAWLFAFNVIINLQKNLHRFQTNLNAS